MVNGKKTAGVSTNRYQVFWVTALDSPVLPRLSQPDAAAQRESSGGSREAQRRTVSPALAEPAATATT
jgi:hypothetical protein